MIEAQGVWEDDEEEEEEERSWRDVSASLQN